MTVLGLNHIALKTSHWWRQLHAACRKAYKHNIVFLNAVNFLFLKEEGVFYFIFLLNLLYGRLIVLGRQ